jgi:hypothetical protein
MKIKIYKVNKEAKKTIRQFAEKNDLTMEARQCNSGGWVASFENCEIKEGMILNGEYGSGKTMVEAIKDYAQKISGKLIVLNAYGKGRKEIYVPELKIN